MSDVPLSALTSDTTQKPVRDWRKEFGIKNLPDMTNVPWPTHSTPAETVSNMPAQKVEEEPETKKKDKRIAMCN